MLPFGQHSHKRTQTKYFLFPKQSKELYLPDRCAQGQNIMRNRNESYFKSEEENYIVIKEKIDENIRMLKLKLN